MVHEVSPQSNQVRPFGIDPALSGLGSEFLEISAKLARGWAEVGTAALIAATEPLNGIRSVALTREFWDAAIAHPSMDRIPSKVIWQDKRGHLLKYESPEVVNPGVEVQEVPEVEFFAYMNDGDILGDKVIPASIAAGINTLRFVWDEPHRGAKDERFDNYVLDTMRGAIEATKAEYGVPEVNVLGWCQGAYSVAVLASLQSQIAESEGRPKNEGIGIKNMVFLTPPFTISEEQKKLGGLAGMATKADFDNLAIARANGGIFPGFLIDEGVKSLRPNDPFATYQRLARLILDGDKPKIQRWKEMNSWVNNRRNMSEDNHDFFMEELYRKNSFYLGKLMLRNMKASLANVNVNGNEILVVVAEEDDIVRPPQTDGGLHLFDQQHLTVMRVPGGHIGGINDINSKNIANWFIENDRSKLSRSR